jgi:hypothetical protein
VTKPCCSVGCPSLDVVLFGRESDRPSIERAICREEIEVHYVLITLSYELEQRQVGNARNPYLRSCEVHHMRRCAQRNGIELTRGDDGVISHIYERGASSRSPCPRAYLADVPSAIGQGSEKTISRQACQRDDIDVSSDSRVLADLQTDRKPADEAQIQTNRERPDFSASCRRSFKPP